MLFFMFVLCAFSVLAAFLFFMFVLLLLLFGVFVCCFCFVFVLLLFGRFPFAGFARGFLERFRFLFAYLDPWHDADAACLGEHRCRATRGIRVWLHTAVRS